VEENVVNMTAGRTDIKRGDNNENKNNMKIMAATSWRLARKIDNESQ